MRGWPICAATWTNICARSNADTDPEPAFTGKSVTGGRLSLGRLTGVPTESVGYAFTAMTSPESASPFSMKRG